MFFEHNYCLELKKRDSDRIYTTCEELLKMSKWACVNWVFLSYICCLCLRSI